MRAKTTKKEPTFEEALKGLEEHVRTLEKGELTLDDALKLFTEGTTLAQGCEKRLNEAKGKVEKILGASGNGVKTEEFGPNG